MNMTLPEPIIWIMKQITSQNEEVFLVGGCVRDLLLNRAIHDYDMTSSMPAKSMIQLFEDCGCKVIPTGLKHGTITVIHHHQAVEITTYRIEKGYKNHRSPLEVQFTRNLAEDLKRRDFTINAMAYHPAVGLIDLYHGQEDLQQHVIRCVGDAEERFEEDALRILRALRFRCQLQFSLASETQIAILAKYELLHNISRERIRDEFTNLLLSNQQHLLQFLRTMKVLPIMLPGIECIFDFEQHSPWHIYDVFTHTDIALNHAKDADVIVKLALVLHDIGKPKSQIFKNEIAHYYGHSNQSAIMAKQILTSLVFSKQIIHDVTMLIQYHDTYVQTHAGMRKLLYAFDNDFQQVERLLKIQECDDSAKNPEKMQQQKHRITNSYALLKDIKINQDIFYKKDLKVNGNDMKAVGFEKEEIRKVIDYLCELVLKNPQQNTKEKLMDFAINYKLSQSKNSQCDQTIAHKD